MALADYFDGVVDLDVPAKLAANWVAGEFSRLLNVHAVQRLRASEAALRPDGLAELLREVESGRVSAGAAKTVLAETFESGESPARVIAERGLGKVSDSGPHHGRGARSPGGAPGPGGRVSVWKAAAVRLPGGPGHEANGRTRGREAW